MVHVNLLFNNFNLRFVQIWTNFKICIWVLTGFDMCWFRPHLNLLVCVVLVCFIPCHELHHIDLSCIILGWASCHVLVLCVYRVACLFSLALVPLRSWGFVRLRLVRLRGFFFFMDSFFFLAGSHARWPSPWISLLSTKAHEGPLVPPEVPITLQRSDKYPVPLETHPVSE